MEQALFEFSMGTTGVVPGANSTKRKPSATKRYKMLKDEAANRTPRKKKETTPDSLPSPSHSLYSDLDDGILIEELPPAELMMKKAKDVLPKRSDLLPKEPSMLHAEDTIYTTQTSILSRQPNVKMNELPFNYSFQSMANMGVTRQDQYRRMKSFENNMLKKKEASERNVLSGIKAVEHHERKLEQVSN